MRSTRSSLVFVASLNVVQGRQQVHNKVQSGWFSTHVADSRGSPPRPIAIGWEGLRGVRWHRVYLVCRERSMGVLDEGMMTVGGINDR